MTKLNDLSTAQLQRVLAIREQIETLQGQLDSIDGGENPSPATAKVRTPAKRKYHMTAAHRRKLIKTLARARAIRWAKIKGKVAAKADKPAKKKEKGQRGGEDKAGGDCPGSVGEGKGGGEDDAVRFKIRRDHGRD